MKVVQIEQPGKIEIVEKPIPQAQKGEALLKIKYCGICGSDMQTFTGNQPFASYPRIPGHEFSAEIVEIEENDRGLEKGMLVTANPYFNCKTCYSCQRGRFNCCESNETMGVQRDGAFSEYITMPIERIYQGKGLEAKTLAMIEPFTIGYHAANRGQIQAGDRVLVLGAGPIGLFAMLSAKLKGAQVWIADFNEKRLAYAKSLGAEDGINLGQEDLLERLEQISPGQGMDVVMEAVGIPESFLNAINAVAFGGKIILIGNGTREVTFNQSLLIKKEVDLYGSRNSLNVFEDLIDYIQQGQVEIDSMVSNVYKFEDSIQAFEDIKNNPNDKLKVLIAFDS